MPFVPYRFALAQRRKSRLCVKTLSVGQTETAGGPSMGSTIWSAMGATGGFKSCNLSLWRLRAQLRAAFGATVVQDLATGLCGHTRTETVAILTNAVRRLECPLHGVSPVNGPNPQRIRSPTSILTVLYGGRRALSTHPALSFCNNSRILHLRNVTVCEVIHQDTEITLAVSSTRRDPPMRIGPVSPSRIEHANTRRKGPPPDE